MKILSWYLFLDLKEEICRTFNLHLESRSKVFSWILAFRWNYWKIFTTVIFSPVFLLKAGLWIFLNIFQNENAAKDRHPMKWPSFFLAPYHFSNATAQNCAPLLCTVAPVHLRYTWTQKILSQWSWAQNSRWQEKRWKEKRQSPKALLCY